MRSKNSKNKKSTISSGLFHALAKKNVKKSARDYFIYFFTLMLAVCLFYSFNSISTQFASLGLTDTLNYLAFSSSVLSMFSVFVCIIMGALVVYANRFLLKRRKKEMGIYATLGMERKDLNRLLMKETLHIGALSLIAGLIMGIFFAQILSLLTARLTGLSLSSYSFMISLKGIFLSIIFFGILFFFVHIFNVKELEKMSLLDMLYADRKNETAAVDNGTISVFWGVLSLIFITGGYIVCFKMSGTEAFKAVGFASILLIAGTVLFFTATLRMAARLMVKNEHYYYSGLNMITTSQFSTRLKTEGRTIATTAILVFLSLLLTILGPGMGKFIMNGIEHAVPYDGSIYYAPDENMQEPAANPIDLLEKAGFKISSFSDNYAMFWTHYDPLITDGLFPEENGSITPIIIGVEDYNRILALQGIAPVQLSENEYSISYAFPPIEKMVKAFSRNPKPLTVNGTTLTLANNGVYNHAWENKNVLSEEGTLIIPQQLAEQLATDRWILNFNYSDNAEDSNAALSQAWLKAVTESFTLQTRQETLISISSDNLLTTYLGLYLGITFLITSGAVLALQQLSQASDSRKRYLLLSKLGVTKKEMRSTLLKQLKMYFGLPLILALINSFVIIISIFRNFQGLSILVIASVIGFSSLLILTVYGIYFVTTYTASKRILEI